MTPRRHPEDALYFLPLGGSDEIGMNLYLYGLDGKWLMVDCGIGFGDDTTPGVEILMPDPGFVEDRRADLLGVVLTHGHEDHLGALQYLWPRLSCPVYATPFTASFLRAKLRETDFAERVPIIALPPSRRLALGPFAIEYLGVTHSIPEANALVLRTRLGTVVHSGDWKLDPNPVVGGLSDTDALHSLGQEGVLALVCDSTNALEPGHSGSEGQVADTLAELIAAQPYRVAVACFATNVARLHSIAHAAFAAGRHCALVGRSLLRMQEVATAAGYLDVPAPFLSDGESANLPRDKVVLICTGSQGEPRSALSRIAGDSHPNIALEAGDTVIFSAREIPGNEKAIARVENALVRQGVRVITPLEEPVHVSGHPARDELVQMYQWLRPQIAIPVHGDPRRQRAHARLAQTCQVPQVIVPQDGEMIRLTPAPAEVVARVPSGQLALDGSRLIAVDGVALQGRRKLIYNGAAVVTLVLDDDGGLLAEPRVALMGLEDEDDIEATAADLTDQLREAIESLPRRRRRDDAVVRETARIALRRAVRDWLGKRPITEVHLVRV